MLNENIIEQFNLLIRQIQAEYFHAQMLNDLEEAKKHSIRLRQMKNILHIIKSLSFEIKDANQLDSYAGIGKGTKKRITEILETGKLAELENKYDKAKQKNINSIQDLSKIIGIGDKLAQKLILKYHITNVEQLKKAISKGKIQVNDKILLGLKYYGVVKGNIPREEITVIEKFLKKTASQIDKNLVLTICGSFRRGKKTSGDIDVILFHPQLKTLKSVKYPETVRGKNYLNLLVELLKEKNFILDDIDKNYHVKYMGFSKYQKYPVRRLDITIVPYESRYTALLHSTGPHELNSKMRIEAKRRGLTLNQYGLYKVGEKKIRIPIHSEKEVFEKLGMVYLPPKSREKFNIGKNKSI